MRHLMLVALVMSSFVNAQEQNPKTTEIADNVYTFTTNGEYISMFAVTKAGVMVFETVNTSHAKSMLTEITVITTGIMPAEDKYFWMKAPPPLRMLRPTNGWLPIQAGTWRSRRNRGLEIEKISNWVEPKLNCIIWE